MTEWSSSPTESIAARGVLSGGGLDRTGKSHLLNCTVFSAATSQPMDCSVKTAILLPTLLFNSKHRQ